MAQGKKFYPVIHCIDPYTKGGIGHALANVKIAKENGTDGVFLIGHGMLYNDLVFIYEQVRKQNPDLWIGVNFLDVHPTRLADIAKCCHQVNALWADRLPPSRLTLPGIELLGGVAFKYINSEISGEELENTVNQGLQLCDVITTSGSGTGKAASLQKLVEIDRYVNRRAPIAIASGVDASNVISMKPYIDRFLVASSITKRDNDRGNEEYLVPEKVKELADLIHTK